MNGFNWTNTLLTQAEEQAVDDILIEYHKVFAQHWDEHGIELKLTTKDNKTVYSYNSPMPIHPQEDLIVELALMQKCRIITVLLFSEYTSPIFAQRKCIGKLRLHVDHRKINTLIPDHHT